MKLGVRFQRKENNMDNMVDAGLRFKGYPIFFGPSPIKEGGE
jgi:hypothetical protein